MIVFYAICGLVGLFLLEVLLVGFGPWMSVAAQPLPGQTPERPPPAETPPENRQDVRFVVGGSPVEGWFYLPEGGVAKAPCIVMAHGFGGTKSMGLELYALRFAAAGFAVLTFDYRHFGQSGGRPRQLFMPGLQIEDIAAAVDYVRGREEVNPEQIVLWGSSAGGGLVICAATADPRIAGIIAQCPAIDLKSAYRGLRKALGLGFFVRLFFHAQRDMARMRVGMSPHVIPIAGRTGTMACFPFDEAFEAYGALAAPDFVNEVCPRFLLRSQGFRPDRDALRLTCPALVQIADHDILASVGAEFKARLAERATVLDYPIGHFEIYHGEGFERAVADQLSFLGQILNETE